MGNVLGKEKREQVIALGRLGWSLRRIEEATGVRRETAGEYLVVRRNSDCDTPGGWGHKPPAKAATSVTTDSDSSKPANEVITGFFGSTPPRFKTGHRGDHRLFAGEVTLPKQDAKRSSGASESLSRD